MCLGESWRVSESLKYCILLWDSVGSFCKVCVSCLFDSHSYGACLQCCHHNAFFNIGSRFVYTAKQPPIVSIKYSLLFSHLTLLCSILLSPLLSMNVSGVSQLLLSLYNNFRIPTMPKCKWQDFNTGITPQDSLVYGTGKHCDNYRTGANDNTKHWPKL